MQTKPHLTVISTQWFPALVLYCTVHMYLGPDSISFDAMTSGETQTHPTTIHNIVHNMTHTLNINISQWGLQDSVKRVE